MKAAFRILCEEKARLLKLPNHNARPVHFFAGEKTQRTDRFQVPEQTNSLDCRTYIGLIRQCILDRSVQSARKVHQHMLASGFQPDLYMANNILTMYAKCRAMEDARKLFDEMPCRNLVSWNVLVSGYSQSGQWQDALELFILMQRSGIRPDSFSFVSLLRACADSDCAEICNQAAASVLKFPFAVDLIVGNALLAVLAKCGSTEFAWQVFDIMPEVDQVSWTTLIAGFGKEEQAFMALHLFRQMQDRRFRPDHIALSSVLVPCATLGDLNSGRQIHAAIIKSCPDSNVNSRTNLLRMYAKSRCLDDARKIFDEMRNPDLISWNSMISAHAENEQSEEALELFVEMQRLGLKPTPFSYGSVLRACSAVASIELGQQIHARVVVGGFEADAFVGGFLADMYVKSGSIDDADLVFEGLNKADVVSWNVMITGNAQHGQSQKALILFDEMQSEGVKPNNITFAGVLAACGHLGLRAEGFSYFESMIQDYGIRPRMEHYAGMVELLGRTGHLKEAQDFIDRMNFAPNAMILGSLLGACRIHGNREIGKITAERLEHTKTAKVPECSWIVVDHQVHSFLVEDGSHDQSEEIYAKLKQLTVQMLEAGYVPDTSHDVEEEQKEHSILFHCEKLAVCFGLINMPQEKPITVFSNLRICSDCHSAIKVVSKIENRYIIVRDWNQFHHFKNGLCSCGDYW